MPCGYFFCISWHLDETYLKVKGGWRYLYRAIDTRRETIVLMISNTCNYQAAYDFLENAFKKIIINEKLLKITTDKHPCYGPALEALKKGKFLKPNVKHR